jgi:predicted transcriptional regulator of viral defense system
MRNSGLLEQIGRGLYRLADLPPLANPDWIPIFSKVPRAVICLISALSYHELTTQVPHYIDIALPSHAQAPRVDGLPLRVFWFSPHAFEAGIQKVAIDGCPIRIYSPEKTLADCFKYRRKIGLDIAVEALRLYRERRKPQIKELVQYARICRVERVMQPYLQALL